MYKYAGIRTAAPANVPACTEAYSAVSIQDISSPRQRFMPGTRRLNLVGLIPERQHRHRAAFVYRPTVAQALDQLRSAFGLASS